MGRNLLALRDALGKPVVEEIVEVADRPERDASRWIFYLWEEQTELQPSWKASYIRKAAAPDGAVYLVGSGSSSLKVEKVFVQERGRRAAELLRGQGRTAAFRELQAPESRFHFLGSFVYVLDARGRSLVDPAYPTIEGRDMSGFRDAVGGRWCARCCRSWRKTTRLGAVPLAQAGGDAPHAQAHVHAQGRGRRRGPPRGVGLLPGDADLDEALSPAG